MHPSYHCIFAGLKYGYIRQQIRVDINLKAGNSEQRGWLFCHNIGWEFDKDPTEVSEVIIPAEFDQTYEKYNKIQKNKDLTSSLTKA